MAAASPDDWLRCLDADVATCRTACLPHCLPACGGCCHLARTSCIYLQTSLDTCSDPRKCDFEPGISWHRLKNKTLLRCASAAPAAPTATPTPSPPPQHASFTPATSARSSRVCQAGVGWIICYDYEATRCVASRPWQAQIITTQQPPSHPLTHLSTQLPSYHPRIHQRLPPPPL